MQNKKSYAVGAFGAGAVIGAGLMYVLDPDRGHRRRTLIRDKAVSTMHRAAEVIQVASKDVQHRAHGAVSELKSAVGSALHREPVSDFVLAERVKSNIGRVLSHPHPLHVTAKNGNIYLEGPVFRHEVHRLLKAACHVRGVRRVVNQLMVFDREQDVSHLPSSLQGEGRFHRKGYRFEFLQTHWSPTARLVAGILGGSLMYFGGRKKPVMGLVGAGLTVRAITDFPISRMITTAAELFKRSEVLVRHQIHVAAPTEQVFAFWTNFSNFPRFMSYIRDVRVNDKGGFHWIASGPAGMSIEWDAIVTRLIPNQVLAWSSVNKAPIPNFGQITFHPRTDNTTQIDIQLTYAPPAGPLGRAAAILFGMAPESKVERDLKAMKLLIESETKESQAI